MKQTAVRKHQDSSVEWAQICSLAAEWLPGPCEAGRPNKPVLKCVVLLQEAAEAGVCADRGGRVVVFVQLLMCCSHLAAVVGGAQSEEL